MKRMLPTVCREIGESTPWLCALFVGLVSLQVACSVEPLQWQTGKGFRFLRVTPPAPGKTGFTPLSAAETGIQFTNVLTIETAARNQNLLSGAGVAAGDFDNDGWCDLYFCSLEGRNTLFRNLGDWKFQDVTDEAGVACPGMFSTGALFADMNGDGKLDLLVTANNGPNALFVNLGSGKFTNMTAAAGITSKPMGSTSMAVADLDGNGTLDLFVANYGEKTILRSGGEVSFRMVNGRPIVSGRAARRLKIINGKLVEYGEPSAVYLNDGALHFRQLAWNDGTFVDESGHALKELPADLSLSVMMRDINGDGFPDIYVCNDFQTPDRIWINDGQAHFHALPSLAMRCTSSFSMGVDFADLDRDGFDDFMVVDMLSRFHSLRMTQMADTNMTAAPVGVVDNRPQIRRNTLFWNRADGTYAEIANFAGVAASDWTWTPAFLDVDLDGYEDLLVSNGHAYDTQDLDTIESQSRGRVNVHDAVARLKDYPRLDTPKYAFRNRGDLTFEETGERWGYNSRQVCHGIAFADLDNDGDLDVVLSSLNAPPVIYRNDTIAPRVQVRLHGKAPNAKGIGARVTLRGGAVPLQAQEIICGGRYLSGDAPMRTFAAGSPTNVMTLEVRWRSGRISTLDAVKANCIYEVAEEQASAPVSAPSRPAPLNLFKDVSSLLQHQHAETEFDDFNRQALLDWKLSQLGPGVAWFDIDGDGRDELFIGAGRGGRLAMFRFAGGKCERLDAVDVAGDDLCGLAGWIKQPGERRMLAAKSNYESSAPSVLSFTWTNSVLRAREPIDDIPSWPGPLAVADYDGDGALDLFVGGRSNPARYPEPVSSLVFRNRAGQLVEDAENSILLKKRGLATGAIWTDLDGDGFPELVIAYEWGPISVFRNNRGKLADVTSALRLDEWTGWWTCVAAGDFDGDGRMDLVGGNWGWNSSFQATREMPALLYYGDFNGDGAVELVDAEQDPVLKKTVPRENLTVLGPVLPFLRASFRTHASARNASVQEMLGDRLRTAKELRANTLASTLFLNRGDHFAPMPLPAMAQWAPVMGMCVADADGDGNEDLFLAQNFFATRKDIPRLDGGRGLWLKGDGQGHFTALSAAESGVVVWGEQRGTAIGDYDEDGRVDLVVSQNGGETKLYHNEGAKLGVRVRLQGPPGNPAGFGAIVRLKYGTGLGPAREVHSGSGHWSQDSAVMVLGQASVPTHVIVRWPGGRISEAPIPAQAREVAVPFPNP